MAANPGTQTFYLQYNEWDQYSNPSRAGPLTQAQIDANYLAGNFVLPPVVNPPPFQIRSAVGVPVAEVRLRRQSLENANDAATALNANPTMLLPVPGLVGFGGPNWTGVKHLGTGGGGTVTLWEYTGPPAAAPAPAHQKIVVKLAKRPGLPGLLGEGTFMTQLNTALSEHIVELLVDPANVISPASALAQGLPPTWVGSVRRLIMEYCSSGSLWDLRALRLDRNRRLEELTLWKIFECLVDGCAVLEHRTQFTLPPTSIPPTSIRNSAADPGVLVHFDLKPTNVMIARDTIGLNHPNTPLCKLGDFGLSVYKPRNGQGLTGPAGTFPLGWAINQDHRSNGTEGYWAPEQFTPRWNYAGFAADPVCGKYGPKTNVWGIGACMYE